MKKLAAVVVVICLAGTVAGDPREDRVQDSAERPARRRHHRDRPEDGPRISSSSRIPHSPIRIRSRGPHMTVEASCDRIRYPRGAYGDVIVWLHLAAGSPARILDVRLEGAPAGVVCGGPAVVRAGDMRGYFFEVKVPRAEVAPGHLLLRVCVSYEIAEKTHQQVTPVRLLVQD